MHCTGNQNNKLTTLLCQKYLKYMINNTITLQNITIMWKETFWFIVTQKYCYLTGSTSDYWYLFVSIFTVPKILLIHSKVMKYNTII